MLSVNSAQEIAIVEVTSLIIRFFGNSIRLGGPSHGIVTKTVHKTLPGDVGMGGQGVDGGPRIK